MKQNTVDHPILDNLSGVIRPGRPTLLLGPPGCGKSTMLKVLAGRYRNETNLRVRTSDVVHGVTQNVWTQLTTGVPRVQGWVPRVCPAAAHLLTASASLGRHSGRRHSRAFVGPLTAATRGPLSILQSQGWVPRGCPATGGSRRGR